MFKNPFSFDGRIRRTEYGISFMIYIVLYVITMALLASGNTIGGLTGLVVIIPTVWFLWAQGAKRCHDIGKSGWYQIIPFFVFVLLFQNGAEEANEYGTNPKNPDQIGIIDSETLDGHLRVNQ